MTGEAKRLGASVWTLELPSRTMPPFSTTNTYLVADSGVALVIDPGFFAESSLSALQALLSSLSVRLVKAVLLTHTHGDHTAGLQSTCSALRVDTVYVHPLELQRLERPEVGALEVAALSDERVLTVGGALVRSLHTPGHSPGHLAFHLPEEGTLLAGDLVAGSGSVWVGLPEGDVTAYLKSLERMEALAGLKRLGPGHGEPSEDPYGRLRESRLHRLDRERQVLDALATPLALEGLRQRIYPGLPAQLESRADSSLLAHLKKLMAEMRVVHLGQDEQGPFVLRS